MDFVGGHHVMFRIPALPPVSVPNDANLFRRFRHFRVLDFTDRTSGYQYQHHHNQDRWYRPSQFDRGTAVDLGRFLVVILRTATSVPDDGVGQEPADHQKNDGAYGHHQKSDLVNQHG